MTLTLTGTAAALSGVIVRGPQTRALTLTGTAAAPSGFITDSGRPSAVLYDTDNTYLAALPLAAGLQYGCTLTDPGFVSLRLPLDDATTDLATAGRFVKVFWEGQPRQAAELTDSGVDMAVDGRMWREWSNLPGVLNLLARGCVWPEYGIDRTYATTRTFGYMSAQGAWYSSGNWTPAEVVHYQTDTGFRQYKPAGLAYPNPWWISKLGPYEDRPAGTVEWVRHHFTTYDTEIPYQILVTGDDLVEMWLDGDRIVAPDTPSVDRWRSLLQVTGTLPPGLHVIAAKVRNSRRRASPLAFILALQQLKQSGDVVIGPPITTSSSYWFASDVLPGFQKADVMRRCVFENRAHNVDALNLVGLAFTADVGTDGVPFLDDPDQYTRDVGEDLLTTLQALCENDADADLDPDTFQLRMWNRKGTDKSATVTIRRGQGVVGSLLSGGVDRAGPKATVLLIQLGDTTWKQYEDTAGVAANGRIVQAVSAGDTNTDRQASKVAKGIFREQAINAATYTAVLTTLDGPQLYSAFDVGDTIAFEDENGDDIPVRVLSAMVDSTVDGAPHVELELVRDDG